MMVDFEVSELSLNVDSFIFKLEINSRMKEITEVLKINLAAGFSYVAYGLNFDCNLLRYFRLCMKLQLTSLFYVFY